VAHYQYDFKVIFIQKQKLIWGVALVMGGVAVLGKK